MGGDRSSNKPGYIGRERELAAIESYIIPGPPYQVCMITAPGGGGKTSLLRMIEKQLPLPRKAVYLDCKNCFVHPDSFTELMAKTINNNTFHDWMPRSIPEDIILLVDSFEMMGRYQSTLMEKLSDLALVLPVIIASRTIPDHDVQVLELPPFDRDIIAAFLINEGLPEQMATDAYQFSKGNPLLLSLFAMAATAKNQVPVDWVSIEADYVSFIIAEVTEEEVFELLEPASMVQSFNRQMLEHMLSVRVEENLFQRLIKLSFVARDGENWHIHEVISSSIRRSLRQYSSKRYYELKRRALDYYDMQEDHNSSPHDRYLLYRLFMCEDDFSREILFSMGINLEREGLHFSSTQGEDLSRIPDFWQNSMLVTGFLADKLKQGYEDTRLMVEYAGEYIRFLRDSHNNLLGYHATIPVCASTMGYFLYSPATREYIHSLPSKELDYLQKCSPRETDTVFIRHLNPSDIGNPLTMNALLQDIILNCIRDAFRIVTTIPLEMFKFLVEGLGFRELPGIYDTTLDMKWPVYELDFRQASIKLWYQWLVIGGTLPHWLHMILTYSKPHWCEQVKQVLENLDNPRFLNHHPLVPLAQEVYSPGNTDESALQKLVLELIGSLASIDYWSKKAGTNSVSQGELLQVTFTQKLTREKAAAQLNLAPTTYYRRLKQACNSLAELMFKIALDTAESRYIK